MNQQITYTIFFCILEKLILFTQVTCMVVTLLVLVIGKLKKELFLCCGHTVKYRVKNNEAKHFYTDTKESISKLTKTGSNGDPDHNFLALHPLFDVDILATFRTVLLGTACDWCELAHLKVTTLSPFESALISQDYKDELAERVST